MLAIHVCLEGIVQPVLTTMTQREREGESGNNEHLPWPVTLVGPIVACWPCPYSRMSSLPFPLSLSLLSCLCASMVSRSHLCANDIVCELCFVVSTALVMFLILLSVQPAWMSHTWDACFLSHPPLVSLWLIWFTPLSIVSLSLPSLLYVTNVFGLALDKSLK